MGTYELDDDLVRRFAKLPERIISNETVANLQARLSEQLPIPVPTKIGAVVRTEMEIRGPLVFVRWALDSRTHSPWIEAGNHEQPYRTDEIGRITEVLSEGVDL